MWALTLIRGLLGDPRQFVLEQRMFNLISLFFGVANIGGSFNFVDFTRYSPLLFVVHIVSGLGFLGLYAWSRVSDGYRALFWPFLLLVVSFLSISIIHDAGAMGGSHYYLFMAVVIITILTRSPLQMTATVVVFAGLTFALFYLQSGRPELIRAYPGTDSERMFDLSVQFAFVQVCTALLVKILSHNLGREREHSDRLLLRILPASIARELKQTERVAPRRYGSATVLFSDFVSFSEIAARLTPEQLIATLDAHFRGFDRIMTTRGVEKIKTIGDGYMAVSGIPRERETHAVDAVLAGLELIRGLEESARATDAVGEAWAIRVGVHTGSLIAGVIGDNKFSYDVWGDTVNTASRLESTGAAGRVNISGETHERVKEFFACEHRGQITTKHDRSIDMYFVTGILPELADESGSRPSERFWERYAALGSR